MKIWKITQGIHNSYDTFDSAVVVAANEADARNILPADWIEWPDTSWADRPDQVDVEYVGEAGPGWDSGDVVCASFNAG